MLIPCMLHHNIWFYCRRLCFFFLVILSELYALNKEYSLVLLLLVLLLQGECLVYWLSMAKRRGCSRLWCICDMCLFVILCNTSFHADPSEHDIGFKTLISLTVFLYCAMYLCAPCLLGLHWIVFSKTKIYAESIQARATATTTTTRFEEKTTSLLSVHRAYVYDGRDCSNR